MIINKCYSYGGCPCVGCMNHCCSRMGDNVDTEQLCEKAREHCEKCAEDHIKERR